MWVRIKFSSTLEEVVNHPSQRVCAHFRSYSRTEQLRLEILAAFEIDDTDWLQRHTICHVSRILEFDWCVTSLSEGCL